MYKFLLKSFLEHALAVILASYSFLTELLDMKIFMTDISHTWHIFYIIPPSTLCILPYIFTFTLNQATQFYAAVLQAP